jgi:LmbE family N-acetylglucosaminyl deacetylase
LSPPFGRPSTVHLFLFPHQDDESPVFFEIERLVQRGQPIRIFFLTTGRDSGKPHPARNAESLRVLSRLGVARDDVIFLGDAHEIPDGQLQKHLSVAFATVTNMVSGHTVASLHVTAFEGGHQDHDAAYLLGTALAQQWNCLDNSFQFPYYHGNRLPGILFKVLDPLAANGPAVKDRIPWGKRLRYLGLLFSYRTQFTTWLGLGPFFLLHFILSGTQVRQHLSIDRVRQKPHEGSMFYERRAFSSYPQFQTDTAAFANQHLPAKRSP